MSKFLTQLDLEKVVDDATLKTWPYPLQGRDLLLEPLVLRLLQAALNANGRGTRWGGGLIPPNCHGS